MKLTISKPALLSAVSAVMGVVKQKSTMPALSHVLLKAEGDTVIITASNLDASIQSKAPAKINAGGEVCLPARRFADAVKYAAGDEIALTLDDKNTATLKAGTSTFKIRGMPGSEFLAIERPQHDNQFTVDCKALDAAINRVSYAQFTDNLSRPELRGISFSIEPNALKLYASNGRRLASSECSLSSDDANSAKFILPFDSVPEVSRILSGGESVAVSYSENQVVFDCGDIVLTSKLVDRPFQPFHKVFEMAKPARSIAVNRAQFIDGLNRARIMTSEKETGIHLELGGLAIDLQSCAGEAGEARDIVPVDYTEPYIKIKCNPDYILDFLQSAEGAEVYLGFSDENKPITLNASGAAGVIMVMSQPKPQ